MRAASSFKGSSSFACSSSPPSWLLGLLVRFIRVEEGEEGGHEDPKLIALPFKGDPRL